jgi:hypothetical protein
MPVGFVDLKYISLLPVNYTIFIFEMLPTVVVKAGNEDDDTGQPFT